MTSRRLQQLLAIVGLGLAAPAWATRSIVACDPVEGACGVATVSHFSTPVYVAHGEPGVAVASMTVPYAPATRLIIELVLSGRSPQEAIDAGVAISPWPDRNSYGVAALDPAAASGVAVGVYQGARAYELPGECHLVGATFVALAGRQTSANVCQAMADVFTATKGRLARRLLAALVLATEVGRDALGEYSPTLAVFSDRHADALLTKYSTWAGLVRSRTWAADLTWDATASMAVDSPADPRDEVLVTPELTMQLQAALLKAGRWQGEVDGKWSGSLEQAVKAVDAVDAFYPRNGTVTRGGKRYMDGVLADFIILGAQRNAIGRY